MLNMKNIIQLNSCTVDLNDVSSIRLARDNTRMIVFTMRTGVEIITKEYFYEIEFRRDYDLAVAKLLNPPLAESVNVDDNTFIDISGVRIKLDDISSYRTRLNTDGSLKFLVAIILNNGQIIEVNNLHDDVNLLDKLDKLIEAKLSAKIIKL